MNMPSRFRAHSCAQSVYKRAWYLCQFVHETERDRSLELDDGGTSTVRQIVFSMMWMLTAISPSVSNRVSDVLGGSLEVVSRSMYRGRIPPYWYPPFNGRAQTRWNGGWRHYSSIQASR